MAHAPVTLPYDLMRELTAAADARSRSDESAAEPCYRSEAFAEDLDGTEPVPAGRGAGRGAADGAGRPRLRPAAAARRR